MRNWDSMILMIKIKLSSNYLKFWSLFESSKVGKICTSTVVRRA